MYCIADMHLNKHANELLLKHWHSLSAFSSQSLAESANTIMAN